MEGGCLQIVKSDFNELTYIPWEVWPVDQSDTHTLTWPKLKPEWEHALPQRSALYLINEHNMNLIMLQRIKKHDILAIHRNNHCL